MTKAPRPNPGTAAVIRWAARARELGAQVAVLELADDKWGETDFAARTVTLSPTLNMVEARSTLAHETIHLERGAAPPDAEAAEEALVEILTAARLIPVGALVQLPELVEHHGDLTVAEWLQVDEFVVHAGLRLAEAVAAVGAPALASQP